MNYAEIRLALRQRTIFEILDLSLVVLKRSIVSLWPFYLFLFSFWAATLYVVIRLPIDPTQRFFVLLPVLLLLRFVLQIWIVLFCGRWIFSDDVQVSAILNDLRQIGMRAMIGRGLVRAVKWASGFVFLIPLWLVLVHRFFDYEHWLLERIAGKELRLRLRNFRSGRVFAFRLLHFFFQILFILLCSHAVKISYEAVTRLSRPEFLSLELGMTFFLLYEPFFLISRFLLYIQTRIDNEAWDIGLIFREGIRRTAGRAMLLLVLMALPLRAQEPERLHPYDTGEADRPCTEEMKKQPYLKCDPAAYRVYEAEEIKKHIPKQRERKPTERSTISGAFLENLYYTLLSVMLAAALLFVWFRYRQHLPDAPPVENAGSKPAVQEFEVMHRQNRLSLIEKALGMQAFREALGHCYLFLMERTGNNEQPGDRMLALTPGELRLQLFGGTNHTSIVIRELLDRYEQVFYADAEVRMELDGPLIRSFLGEMR